MKAILDIAQYILEQTGYISTMKLQKLAYYSQALCLVKTNEPLFSDEMEAWANGPVSPVLFNAHRGKYVVSKNDLDIKGQTSPLSDAEKNVVNQVISCLGEYTGEQLSDLTHNENPWIEARKGLSLRDRGNEIIPKASMEKYYSSPNKNPLFS